MKKWYVFARIVVNVYIYRQQVEPKNKEMSSILISSIRGKCNDLGEDVLQMIFQLLKGEDLVNCEAVCRQWRDILLSGRPWMKLFERQFADRPLGQQAAKQFGIIGSESSGRIATDKYRDVYKFVHQVKHNWIQGKFTKWTHPTADNSTAFHLEVREDYVCWNVDVQEENCAERRRGSVWVDTTKAGTKDFTEIRSSYKFRVLDEAGVNPWFFPATRRGTLRAEIHEPGIACIQNLSNVEDARSSFYYPVSFTGKQLFCYSSNGARAHQEHLGRLRGWELDREKNQLILKHDHIRRDCRNLKVEAVDEFFVCAVGKKDETVKALHFFDTETFEPVREVSVSAYLGTKYVRGLLFERRATGDFGVLDVASGTRFNDVKLPIRREDEPFVLMGFGASLTHNSSVIVISWQYRPGPDINSLYLTNFSVYDMEAVKNVRPELGTPGCCSPLYTLQFPLFMNDWEMDETRLAFVGTWGPKFTYLGNRLVIVLNFSAPRPAEAEAEEGNSKKPPEEKTREAAAADPVHEAVNVEMKVFKEINFWLSSS
jgi:hypothetical protein